MKTQKDIEKEIEELSGRFKDMLTVDDPENLDDYPEEELKDVYGEDLYFSDIMQKIIKLKALLQQNKEIVEKIDKWGDKYCDEMQEELQELKSSIIGSEERK